MMNMNPQQPEDNASVEALAMTESVDRIDRPAVVSISADISSQSELLRNDDGIERQDSDSAVFETVTNETVHNAHQDNDQDNKEETQAEQTLQCLSELMIHSQTMSFQENDVRVAMIGNVDSGKSTLVGVLTNALLDDGRGLARSLVLRHRHEQENGRTSAVTVDVMGFHADNRQVTLPAHASHGTHRSVQEQQRLQALVNQTSDHSVTLIDLCGHEKYLKTTLFGLTGLLPDVAIVVVGSNMGVQVMTREHISIASALHLPLIIVVTKCDICPAHIMKATKMALARLLRAHRKMPFPVKDASNVSIAVQGLQAMQEQSDVTVEGIAPVFTVSSVTGEGLDHLRSLLAQLRRSPVRYGTAIPSAISAVTTTNTPEEASNASSVPQVLCLLDGIFEVKGVGIVLGGTLSRGAIHVADTLYLGPDRTGNFMAVSIKSIESRRESITEAMAGQSATFAIRPVNRKIVFKKSHFRKGMVLASGHRTPTGAIAAPRATRDFEAQVIILHHSTTVAAGYQPVIHCGVCRQSAQIVSIADSDSLCTGEHSVVRFRFVYQPEFLLPGATFIFREGKAKGIGKVVQIFPVTPLI